MKMKKVVLSLAALSMGVISLTGYSSNSPSPITCEALTSDVTQWIHSNLMSVPTPIASNNKGLYAIDINPNSSNLPNNMKTWLQKRGPYSYIAIGIQDNTTPYPLLNSDGKLIPFTNFEKQQKMGANYYYQNCYTYEYGKTSCTCAGLANATSRPYGPSTIKVIYGIIGSNTPITSSATRQSSLTTKASGDVVNIG